MKIPKQIKISGFMWDIKEDNNVATEGNCFGSTHYRTQNIFIEPTATEQKKEQTLIHEILHAIWWQNGLAERYKGDDSVREEEIIHTLSHGIYQVLKDNNFLK